MVNRVLVGAHYGLKDWLIQRATAVIMALYTLILLTTLLAVAPHGFDSWHAIFANGFMRFATFLFLVSLFYHAWIGIRDLWMDYIKPTGVRLALHLVTLFLLVGYAGWAAQILWRL